MNLLWNSCHKIYFTWQGERRSLFTEQHTMSLQSTTLLYLINVQSLITVQGTVGQTAAIIDSYIFVWSYKGSKMDSKNVVKLFVSLFTVLNIKFKSTNFGPLQENG